MDLLKKHPQWAAVEEVCNKLIENGYEAWLAGGCVRDALLGREPNDFDIATNALPDQVQSLFEKTVSIGKEFGVIAVPFQGFQLEIATFRSDGKYLDGRKPESVQYSSPEEDAKRRDFKINAMFYDFQKAEIVDFVGGKSDLQKKLISTVGVPKKRFEEDHLRILRAVRFAAQIGFNISSETYIAVRNSAKDIKTVSIERVRSEVEKILLSRRPARGLQLLDFLGLFSEIFPNYKKNDEWTLTKIRLQSSQEKSIAIQWSLFIYPLFKKSLIKTMDIQSVELECSSFTNTFFAKWKMPKVLLRSIIDLTAFAILSGNISNIREADLLIWLADKDKTMILQFCSLIDECDQSLISSLFDRSPISENFLNGNDLKNAGIDVGPSFKKLLHEAHCLQIEGVHKSKEEAIEWLRKKGKS